jgi:hypothetical protein
VVEREWYAIDDAIFKCPLSACINGKSVCNLELFQTFVQFTSSGCVWSGRVHPPRSPNRAAWGFMPIGESPGVPTPPIAAGILLVAAGVLFAVGYFQAPLCGGLSLVYIGIGTFLISGAVAVLGLLRTAGFVCAFGVVLVVAGFLIGSGGVTGCGI